MKIIDKIFDSVDWIKEICSAYSEETREGMTLLACCVIGIGIACLCFVAPKCQRDTAAHHSPSGLDEEVQFAWEVFKKAKHSKAITKEEFYGLYLGYRKIGMSHHDTMKLMYDSWN